MICDYKNCKSYASVGLTTCHHHTNIAIYFVHCLQSGKYDRFIKTKNKFDKLNLAMNIETLSNAKKVDSEIFSKIMAIEALLFKVGYTCELKRLCENGELGNLENLENLCRRYM